MSVERHEHLIEKKHTTKYRISRVFLLIAYACTTIGIIYLLIEDQRLAASLWAFSAAVIFALQNFVASIFARLYIKWAWIYEKWDIIKSGNPFMSAVGEVQEVGIFFTKLKEVDENDLAFTGKVVSFPNYLIFNSGIFNYTRNDLLFWHEFSVTLACRDQDIDKLVANFKDIIWNVYTKTLESKVYNRSFLYKNLEYKPKYQITLTTQWLVIKVRLMVHFYKVFDTNNEVMRTLIKAHKEWKIELLTDNDYTRLQPK